MASLRDILDIFGALLLAGDLFRISIEANDVKQSISIYGEPQNRTNAKVSLPVLQRSIDDQ